MSTHDCLKLWIWLIGIDRGRRKRGTLLRRGLPWNLDRIRMVWLQADRDLLRVNDDVRNGIHDMTSELIVGSLRVDREVLPDRVDHKAFDELRRDASDRASLSLSAAYNRP